MDRNSFFEAGTLRTTTVEYEGNEYLMQEPSASVADKAIKISEEEGVLSYMAHIVCQCALKEDGKRLFSDGDYEKLLKVRVDMLQALGQAAIEIAGNQSAKDTEKN